MAASDVRALEELTLASSAVTHELRLDGWILRATPGSQVGRSNSVTALDAGKLELADKIARCEAFYDEFGQPAKFRLNAESQPGGVDAALAARGYLHHDLTRAMTAALDGTIGDQPTGSVTFPTLAEWIALSTALRGTPRENAEIRARRLAAAPVAWLPAAIHDAQGVACSGIAALSGEWLGLFDVFTRPAVRGCGHATQLARALIGHCKARGATRAYLQVNEDNAPAWRVYERLGFRTVYHYWYRVQPMGR